MARSGLLFAPPPVAVVDLARRSHDLVSWNGWTEAPCTLGRYLCGLDRGDFDAYVNVGSFNCAPANIATAVIGAGRQRNEVPCAALDADGTALTQGQLRQLETVAAQCRARAAARAPAVG